MEENQIAKIDSLEQEEPYPLPNGWSTFICSPDNIINAWAKLNQFPILFDDRVRGNLDYFSASLFARDSIVLATGDYGICIAEGIVPFRSSRIHLTFWDRRFKGRREECLQAIKWLFYHFKLIRSTILVPYTSLYTIKFIKSIGFRVEGEYRKSYQVNGRLYNQVIFGLLKEDLFVTNDKTEVN